MASYFVFSVQLLLLISASSASHYYGGSMTFVPKGRTPNGSLQVDLHFRETYSNCYHYFDWRCWSGNCGQKFASQTGVIDTSTNSAPYTNGWCEMEIVESRYFPSDDPFVMRKAGCCWIYNVNHMGSWRLFTHVDLKRRSDSWQLNSSPNNAILPFLRVPSNCPRSYHLMTVDPDGDQVICRYGTIPHIECSRCLQPTGFYLDEGTCVLHYGFTEYTGIYGFELVVEDFPRSTITLTSTNGTQTTRSPLAAARRKRAVYGTTAVFPRWWTTTSAGYATTSSPTTTSSPIPPTNPWWKPTQAPPNSNTNPWWWWPAPASPTTTTSSPTGSTHQRWQLSAQSLPVTTNTPNTQTTTTTTTSSTSTNAPLQAITRRQYPVPLSKLPLQFSLLVDSPAPSCTEGEYLPRFVYPTPSHGDHLNAQVNEEFEMRIKAQASQSIVGDIIFSGPLNTTKRRIAQGEFYIRWTPTQDNLGDHVPICFIAEATLSSQKYQSEMRCVVLNVEHVKAHMTCNETSMTVELDKASFNGLSEDHLQLIDSSSTACSLHSNGTHVIGIIPLNACGTTIEEDNDNLIFKNEITTFEDVRDIVTRKHLLEIGFSCQYPKRGNVTLGFTIHRDNFTLIERGFGMFTYSFEFYPDNHFGTMVSPSLYPLDYEVGEKIYMQIQATSSVNNTVLFVESCRASPYDNPNYQPNYPIIENGCIMDPTVVIYSPSHNKQFRISIDAFKFIGIHDQVYISCSVILCEAGNNNTRCAKGCVTSNQQHHRRKREAVIETGVHFISQGPLRLRSTPASESRVTGLNLNLAFIAGCLLAAIAMICGVMIQRFKRAAVQYQPLPTTEQ
ncbi:uncharacterized protein LOC115558989 [Gadus morhua]|uniref:Uncharacterized LOC115558989 n=1 Tax=Gadus morhua TaxID=8049 RepID=A0A8C4Z334_GADMO|nr:uncharacterized protein LOC115558989 [Gadus morhua]